jgi:methyl-accepting chemotaxis protein
MKITIKSLLVGTTLLLTVLIGVIGGLALLKMRDMQTQSEDISSNWLPAVRTLGLVKSEMLHYRLLGMRHIANSDEKILVDMENQLPTSLHDIETASNDYIKTITGADEQKLWNGFASRWPAYVKAQQDFVAASRRGDKQKAADILNASSDAFYAAADALAKDIEFNEMGVRTATLAADLAYRQAFWTFLVFGSLAALSGIGAMIFVVFGVTGPLNRLTEAMRSVAGGDFRATIPSVGASNEIGDQARALVVFRDNLVETERLRADRANQEKLTLESQFAERNRLADQFQTTMGTLADRFVRSSNEVADAARNLSATAEETARQAQVVSGAAEEASANVQTVAAGAEELSASIQEINSQVSKSTQIAGEAADEAARSEANVKALTEAAVKIGDVVSLIKDIAAQTNLLALNATIEAARAGEAGRGFAIVASEVKQLAAETANATDEISAMIGEIQAATNETVASIGRIVATINTIRGVTASIAGAVE